MTNICKRFFLSQEGTKWGGLAGGVQFMLQAKDRAGHKLSKANIWDCNKYKYRYRKGIEILIQIQIRVRKEKGQGCALAGSGKQRCERVENLGELASCIGWTNCTTSVLQCTCLCV